VLGAIVSPTDPLAATSIARRLEVPRKLVTIVEGEPGQRRHRAVLYRVAVAAVVTGSFSAFYTGGLFLVVPVAASRSASELDGSYATFAVGSTTPSGDHDLSIDGVRRIHSR
jgi:CPA1 family monovalent cation:H+ antiporter